MPIPLDARTAARLEGVREELEMTFIDRPA
jgi:hypothetical protein